MKILICPDKFKGTLSAAEAADAIAAGWRETRPGDDLKLQPISDGGDGFGEILGMMLHAEIRIVDTVDAAFRPCSARWWLARADRKAVIESAEVIGLARLPRGKFHPFDLDTRGLASLLRGAAADGADTAVVGIGGSATNDGGFGLAAAMGWRFLDAKGKELQRWTELSDLERLEPPSPPPALAIRVAVDVTNPLLGPNGATRIYGPQKGLRESDFDRAEACLKRLAEIAAMCLGREFSQIPGSGAAGGLGFGLCAFLNAVPESGFKLLAESGHLRDRIREVDRVITGEGSLDHSSLMGKAVGELAELCREAGRPCVALTGTHVSDPAVDRQFTCVASLVPGFCSPEAAMQDAAGQLRRLAARTAISLETSS